MQSDMGLPRDSPAHLFSQRDCRYSSDAIIRDRGSLVEPERLHMLLIFPSP